MSVSSTAKKVLAGIALVLGGVGAGAAVLITGDASAVSITQASDGPAGPQEGTPPPGRGGGPHTRRPIRARPTRCRRDSCWNSG